jgi:hypothetical protein
MTEQTVAKVNDLFKTVQTDVAYMADGWLLTKSSCRGISRSGTNCCGLLNVVNKDRS